MAEFNHGNTGGAGSAEMLAYLVEQTEKQNRLLEQISTKQKNTKSAKKKASVEVDMGQFLRECLDSWIVIAIFAVALTLAVLLAGIITYRPEYTSTVKLYVNNVGASGNTKTSMTSSDITASKNLVDTYAEILRTNQMLGKIAEDLENDGITGYTGNSLYRNIKCGSSNNTEVFYVTVTDKNAGNAVAIANRIGEEFPEYVAEIITGASVKIVDPASSAKRIESGIFRKTILAFIAGIIIPMGYILIVKCILNDSVESVSWVTENFPEIPLLSEIPDAAMPEKSRSYYRRSTKNS